MLYQAKEVQGASLAVPIPQPPAQLKRLPSTRRSGQVFAGGKPHQAKEVPGTSLAVPIPQPPAQLKRLPSTRRGARVVVS